MSLSLVSVAVPAYNHAAFLDACLESVRNQSYPRLELVVVDDGSTDTTPGGGRALRHGACRAASNG